MTETATKERPILFRGPMVQAILRWSKTQTRRIIKPQPPAERPCAERDQFGPGWRWWPERVAHGRDDRHWPEGELSWLFCPYGQPGDRLWVRETWALKPDAAPVYDRSDLWRLCAYRIDGETWSPRPERWRSPIHMPRWASRITLEITGVRVERLQDISEEDAVAEGFERTSFGPSVKIVLADGRSYDTSRENRSIPKVGDDWDGSQVILVHDVPEQDIMSARSNFRSLWDVINGPDSWDANPFVWVVEFRKLTEGE